MNPALDTLGHAHQVADRLLAIEIKLRQMNCWQNEPLAAGKYLSCEPFCLDTMSFEQWLQFVLLPRLKQLVEDDQPLPTVSGVAPMAEEHYRSGSDPGQALIRELAALDELLGAKPG
ncbi:MULTISPECIES: YqcC family protein [unclassified Marinobacter]|uniref:YqcC family protein n=1 Tax=unclassified Marinobacter TaxID=83889 RepID=UPI000BF39A98|nr:MULTISPECIES: YqcC family protein [unclassified Marinobacter]PFG08130.1 uncharacterized protein YqcC (DUF446 family) [Marinobacter sp. LV10MA510-1]PFG53948.1 uncharacterized protein YqcC (DUF446 family) [Marinobacter sp. LV10R520-4]